MRYTDTQLLDTLATHAASGLGWSCRWSTTGRGLRLHQDPSGGYPTPREALAAFIESIAAPPKEERP